MTYEKSTVDDFFLDIFYESLFVIEDESGENCSWNYDAVKYPIPVLVYDPSVFPVAFGWNEPYTNYISYVKRYWGSNRWVDEDYDDIEDGGVGSVYAEPTLLWFTGDEDYQECMFLITPYDDYELADEFEDLFPHPPDEYYDYINPSKEATLYNKVKTLTKQWVYDKTEMDTALSGKVDSTDSRLTNSRTPTAHNQASSTITDSNTYNNIGNTTNTLDNILSNINTKLGSLASIELVEVTTDKGTANANTMNKLYLVAESTSATNDNYEIFVTVRTGTSGNYNYAWEKIDTARIDLSNYLTTANASQTYVAKEAGKGLFSGSYSDLTNKPSYTATVTSSTTGAVKIGSININGSNVDIYSKDTIYTHPTPSGLGGAKTSGLYKISTDAKGHVTGTSSATSNDLIDANAHSNIGTNADSTQGAINTATDTKIGNINAKLSNQEIILEYQEIVGNTITLPTLYDLTYGENYTGDVYVDWGDGTIEQYTNNNYSHTYSTPPNSEGMRIIKIIGEITAIGGFNGYNINSSQYLTKVILPKGITRIGMDCFYGCNQLASVVLPSTLQEILGGAFFDCNNLHSLNIPSSVVYMYDIINNSLNFLIAPSLVIESFFSNNPSSLPNNIIVEGDASNLVDIIKHVDETVWFIDEKYYTNVTNYIQNNNGNTVVYPLTRTAMDNILYPKSNYKDNRLVLSVEECQLFNIPNLISRMFFTGDLTVDWGDGTIETYTNEQLTYYNTNSYHYKQYHGLSHDYDANAYTGDIIFEGNIIYLENTFYTNYNNVSGVLSSIASASGDGCIRKVSIPPSVSFIQYGLFVNNYQNTYYDSAIESIIFEGETLPVINNDNLCVNGLADYIGLNSKYSSNASVCNQLSGYLLNHGSLFFIDDNVHQDTNYVTDRAISGNALDTVEVVVTYTDNTTETLTLFKK